MDAEVDGEAGVGEGDPKWKSKDGTEWLKVPPQPKSSGRTPKQNIIHGIVGITPYATSRIKDETSAFKLAFVDHTIKEMLLHTNQKGREKQGEEWAEMDLVELEAFIGLMILAAVFKGNKEALEGLWAEEMGRPIFRATMPLKRFRTIHAMLRFDDKATRSSKKGSGILNVWNPWVDQQALLFRPNESITIDEQLYGYRGRVFCKVFMDKKPDKYGFRIDHATCSATGFVLKSQLYLGKSSDNRSKNVSETTVCNLVLNAGYEGRNVTTDNYYTSASLAASLLKNAMTLVGTLRKNKRCIPPALLDLKGRSVGSSLYAYSGTETILSYVPKKNKNVLLLSTLHTDLQQDNGQKPSIIHFYNSTKGAVDTVDRRIASYSVKRATRNWMVVIVSDMIDLSLNNAYILYNAVFPGEFFLQFNSECKFIFIFFIIPGQYVTKNAGKRRFLQELGNRLIDAHIVRRQVLPRGVLAATVVRDRKRKANESTQSLEASEGTSGGNLKRGKKRCALCRGNDNKYRAECSNCHKTLCSKHSIVFCTYCKDD